jgi:vanillate O-demethylase monooxygenase subunit
MPILTRRRGDFNPPSKLPQQFVYDAWYVAAWSEEISRKPLRRILLEEPVVFYRRTDGSAVALADRCAHRAYPLSRGEVRGDSIVCGYHGFVFDACGVCTWVPGQDYVPKTARVRPYPLVQSGPLVWIWMGDPEAADPARIPEHHWTHDAGWSIIKDKALVKARYGLLLDNLTDLSHETFIHAATIGTAEVADTPVKVEVDGDIVRGIRHMEGVESPPFYRSFGLTGKIDRWQDFDCTVPSYYTLHVRIAEHGAADDAAFRTKIMYALTPETKHSTYDFWVIARPSTAPKTDWRDWAAIEFQNRILFEDVAALEALEANLPADGGPWQELSIKNDAAGIQWRKVLAEKLRAEQTPMATEDVDRLAKALG